MAPGKQKPNDACACGSGTKHKKCCGGAQVQAAAAAAAPVQRAGRPPCARQQDAAFMAFLEQMNAALDADAAHDYRRAAKQAEKALPLALAIAAKPDTSERMLCDVLGTFTIALEYRSRLGDLEGAEDVAARGVAVLTPPHTFYPAAVGCLSHAAWRDKPLDATDTRVTLGAARVRLAVLTVLSVLHGELGVAYSRAMRSAPAVAAYEAALAAIAHEPPSAERNLKESAMQARARGHAAPTAAMCVLAHATWLLAHATWLLAHATWLLAHAAALRFACRRTSETSTRGRGRCRARAPTTRARARCWMRRRARTGCARHGGSWTSTARS
jgi:tetratricopeptide (TPR) repeat protein